jgi:hypothetical protein
MAQRPGFDLSRMSTASKILLGGGVLFLINSFLPYWQRVCQSDVAERLGVPFVEGTPNPCDGVGLWEGVGIIAGLAVVLILAMEILIAAQVRVDIGTAAQRAQIEAGLAGAVLVFTILRVIIDNDFLSWGAWLGIILSAVVAYGGYMRWQEPQAATPPAPPTGGFTA